MVGRPCRPFPHVVRGVLCEADEGIAEVREVPSLASAVSEGSGDCRGRSGSLHEIMQIVTSAVRVIT